MAIMTQEQARETAHAVGLKLLQADEANSQDIKELVDAINNTPLADAGLEEIGSLLAMPDNQFVLIAPIFLEELEKTYNDVNTQMLMIQTLNASGHKLDDFEKEYLALCDVIDSEIGAQFTTPKRDFLKSLIGITYNSVAGIEGIAKKTINIPIEYCHPDAKMPAYAHPSDAGMDVYALEEITINPGETKLIPLGIKVAIPLGYELQVRPKSGRCLKTKLRVANAPGTIDAGYRDEVGVIIENVDPPIRAIHTEFASSPNDFIPIGAIDFGSPYTIGKGEKFAQLVLSEVPKVCWIEVEHVTAIGEDRGGGFGSTGV